MHNLTEQNIDDISRIQVWLKDVTTLAPFNSIARTVECNAELRGEIDRLRAANARLQAWHDAVMGQPSFTNKYTYIRRPAPFEDK